jgi:methylase of polypeptide subunit release factors
MSFGGFDCIIGNPPYVRSINLKENSELLWEAYRSRYRAASSREWDIYLIFVEKGLELLNARGQLGFILPNKFLNSQVGENLRAIISERQHLQRIVHFGAFQIFPDVTTYTCLLFLSHNANDHVIVDRYAGPVNKGGVPCPLPEQSPEKWHSSEVPPAKLTLAPWDFTASGGDLMEKLRQSVPLERVAGVFKGTGTNADKVYMVEDRGGEGNLVRVYSHEKQAEYTLEPIFLEPAFRGRSIGRYTLTPPSLFLIVPYERVGQRSVLVTEKKMAELAPRMLAYLRECKPRLDEREKGRFKGEGWYCYGRPQNLHRFDVLEKIVLPDVANRGAFFLDREGRWLLDTAYGITIKPGVSVDLRFVLAVLNSPVLTYFLKETGTGLRGGYFRMKTAYLNPFPIPVVDFDNPCGKASQDHIGNLVDSMLALHKQLASAKAEAQRGAIQRQIEATDAEIDRLVYDLYGLTEEETAIVEGRDQ